MKTRLFTIIALSLITITVQAQVNFGAKGGLNLFKISPEEGDASDMKLGIHVGGLAHIHMSDRFALQPEIYYSIQGGSFDDGGNDTKLNLNYLNIPILFQYMFDNGFRIQAGPQIGILTGARAKSDDDNVDVKDSFNSLDFGIPLGVGYVTPGGLGFDVRYQIGLSNVGESDDDKAFNRGFQLGVFYLFEHE